MIAKITQFFELLDHYGIRFIKHKDGQIRTRTGYCPVSKVIAAKTKRARIKLDAWSSDEDFSITEELRSRIITAADIPNTERHIRYQLLKRCR